MEKGEKNGKQLIHLLFVALMSMAMICAMSFQIGVFASAAANEGTGGDKEISKKSDLLELDSKVPSEMEEYPDDMYGADADQIKGNEPNTNTPFMLSEENELMMYMSAGAYQDDSQFGINNQYIAEPARAFMFNKLSMTPQQIHFNDDSTEDYLYSVNKTSDPTMEELDQDQITDLQGLAFAQGVTLDATGSGRRDYAAIVGLKDKVITLIIQKAKDGSDKHVYQLGTASWMADYDRLEMMGNYISITAGDYDFDGKDSVVVYCCLDGADPKIVEVGHESNGSWFSSAKEIAKISDLVTMKKFTSSGDAKYRPIVSLATGDFDGDSREELAYSAGFLNTSDNLADGYQNTSYSGMSLEDFATTVGTFKYDGTTKAFAQTSAQWLYDKEKTNQGSGSTKVYNLQIIHGGAIAAGDVDGDSIDEIIACGYTSLNSDDTAHATATEVNDQLSSVNHVCNWDHSNFAACVVEYESNEYTHSAVRQLPIAPYLSYTFDSWMGEYEPVFPQIAVACAKVNGASAPETTFIGGRLYDFSDKAADPKFSPPVMENAGLARHITGCNGRISSEESVCNWIRNVTVGNFIGDAAGREQFVYTFWGKNLVDSYYSANVGLIAGAGYSDQYEDGEVTGYTNAAGYISAPATIQTEITSNTGYIRDDDEAGYFYSTKSRIGSGDGYLGPQGYSQIIRIRQNSANGIRKTTTGNEMVPAALNAIPLAVDVDDDGVMGRFRHKGYVYTDPEVLTVLQAGPYFKELDVVGGYTNGCETSYEITTGYGSSSSKGTSGGIEAGFAGEISFPGAKVALELGYSAGTSYEFEEAHEIEYSYTFAAAEKTVVAMTRVPVLIYTYDIFNPKTGKWANNGYTVKVPLAPRYFKLTVSDYNKFVDEYNAAVSKAGGTDKLVKIKSGIDLPEGYEGVPDKYWTSASLAGTGGKKLSPSSATVGSTSGPTGFSMTKSTSTTETEEITHGFHFNVTLQAGANYTLGEFWAGGYVSGDLENSLGYSKTTMSAEGSGATVTDFNEDKLIEVGFDEDMVKAFSFTWDFGTWKRKLQTNGADVPFFGYFVTEVSRTDRSFPRPATIQGPEVIKLTKGYAATSSKAFIIDGEPAPKVTMTNIDSRITFDQKTKKITIASGLPVGNYPLILKATNNFGEVRHDVLIMVSDKSANPLKIKAKTATVKYKKLKKKAQTLKVAKIIKFTKKGQGKMSYKLVSVKKAKFKKYFKINAKTGALTIKKGLKKGTYKVKVKVKAAGNSKYKPSAWKTVTCTVKVK